MPTQGVAVVKGEAVSGAQVHTSAKVATSTPPEGCIDAMKRYWPQSEWNNALVIMRRESGLQPSAINYNTDGTIDRGCFQVNSIHKDFDITKEFNPDYNAQVALIVYQAAGWRAWSSGRGLLW